MEGGRARQNRNLLPFDGDVRYHGVVFDQGVAGELKKALLSRIPWESDEIRMFGKTIVTARKVAWFSDNGVAYSYSGTTKTAHEWNDDLLRIKSKVEAATGASYNSCLLNLYHHGEEGMGWHSDDERSIEPKSSIASVSFGAERKFSLKHKQTKETVSIFLENGSLLDMRGETQNFWLHQLPKTKLVRESRINLTFRKMVLT